MGNSALFPKMLQLIFQKQNRSKIQIIKGYDTVIKAKSKY